MLHRVRLILGLVVTIPTGIADVRAADIYLKAQAPAPRDMVRLADVADIHNGSPSDAQQLSQTELFPVPAAEQYITARQVREALLARGVDLRQHTISGASIIELTKDNGTAPARIFARPAIGSEHEPAHRVVHPVAAAIVRFLKSQVDGQLPWQIELSPPGERADGEANHGKLPDASVSDVAVTQTERRPERGSIRPWLGRQQFVMRWNAAGRRCEGVVAAEIKLPPTIVVAGRDIPRGTVLQPGDLKTRAVGEADRSTQGFEFAEDAVGKELLRALRAGQVIATENVESPDLVRRGEKVSIIVNHHGVRVRTEGRAQNSGGRGDAVLVESAARKNTFQAVVTGVNEVQVDVGSAQVASRPRRETR